MMQTFYEVWRKNDGRLLGLFKSWSEAGEAIRADMEEAGPDMVWTIERVTADINFDIGEVGAHVGQL